MSDADAAIRQAIADALGLPGEVTAERAVGGGSIAHARRLTLADGRHVFVKTDPTAPADQFPREAEGLTALRRAATGDAAAIRVPQVVAVGDDPAFLVLEWIEPGRPGPGFSETFGRAFAALHRNATGERWGFDHDNYLGATPQPNGWMDDWVAFWRRRRLGHQLRLAEHNGHLDGELRRLGEALMDRLDGLIGDVGEPACLLHGDLWGGNYLAAEDGRPVLIDPAAYYGQREADLAMTRLFGGFDARFYAAYEEAWPLPPGSDERLAVYELYHLLNHLNLFGTGYRSRCIATLRRLV